MAVPSLPPAQVSSVAVQETVTGLFTVTVKVHEGDMLPEASVAVPVTVVAPDGKFEPDGGIKLMVAPGQLSVGLVTG